MQNTIKEFNKVLAERDLFAAWQNELRLRRLIRNDSGKNWIVIENLDEFSFLKRSFYFGPGRDLFFDILYHNAANHTILTCIMQSPPDLINGFLDYLGRNILKQKPLVKDLQFLITIYREEFRNDFVELINQMDHDLSSQLLARTSNNDLRHLFNQRLLQEDSAILPDPWGPVDAGMSEQDYQTMYGDKIQIMAAAIKSLKISQAFEHSGTSLNRETIENLLDCGDLLFRAGLLTDCLAILTKMVNHPGVSEHSLLLSGQEPYYQQINALLHKALPIYAMLVNPTDPHHYALDLYRGLFPGFGPDLASLVYLDIQSIVMGGLQGHRQYINYEIAQKGSKILSLRPNDQVAAIVLKSGKLSNSDLSGLELSIKQRIPYQPHEVFIIMEIMRLWHRENRIVLDKHSVLNLYNYYLQFFNWIPAAPFMNEQVQNQLGTLVDDKSRSAGEKILRVFQDASGEDLITRYSDPDVNKLKQKLLLSKYMGVL